MTGIIRRDATHQGVSSEGLLNIQVTINNIAMLIDSQLGMAVLRKYVIFHVTICRWVLMHKAWYSRRGVETCPPPYPHIGIHRVLFLLALPASLWYSIDHCWPLVFGSSEKGTYHVCMVAERGNSSSIPCPEGRRYKPSRSNGDAWSYKSSGYC